MGGEMADAPDLGSGTARCAGSSPVPCTSFFQGFLNSQGTQV